MSEPIWLDTSIVLDVHAEQLALFGGADGVRDVGLLESALARPLNKFAHGERSLAALAASYAFGIARNHPFVDGNKRAAFASIIGFSVSTASISMSPLVRPRPWFSAWPPARSARRASRDGSMTICPRHLAVGPERAIYSGTTVRSTTR